MLVSSHEEVRGLLEAQEEDFAEEGINYVAMRNLFVRESKEAMKVKVVKKTREMHIRESAHRVEMGRTVCLFTLVLLHIFNLSHKALQSQNMTKWLYILITAGRVV